MSTLTDFRVAVLATDGFEETELTEPVKALKDAASSSVVKAEDVKKAIAKAKFLAASAAEGREGFVSMFGPKVIHSCVLFLVSSHTASASGRLRGLPRRYL